MTKNIKPPVAQIVPHEFTIHNETIKDEYSWLRADGWPNKITDKKVLSYLEEENKYFEQVMSPHKKETDNMFEELKGRIKLEDQSTYTKKDDYFYYSRTEADKDYGIYCRKKGSTNSEEEILLNVNELAKGQKYTQLGAFAISPDHKLMAYSTDFTGGEKYKIVVYNLETKEFLKDEIEGTIGPIIWHEKIGGFFYTPTSENWRHDKLMFHKLDTSSDKDKLILHEKDHLYSVSAGKSSSKEYIFVNVSGHDSNEIYFINMHDESFKTYLIKERKETIQYGVDHHSDSFFMHTNDRAKNFQLLKSPSKDYNQDNWKIFIAEDKNRYFSGFDLTQSYLLLNYKEKGLPVSLARDLNSGVEKQIKFPDEAFTAGIYSTNFEEDDIRVSYSSLARPSTVYNYNFAKENLSILKTQEIPSGFSPDEYKVERVFVKTDSVEVPVSLFYKRSLFKKDGSNPLYLYGYGSYGHSVPPSFRNSAVSLVDRGFVYAVAHIRGGDDLGHDWYEAAKFLNKKRTFNDFIASAEYLINNKYTSKGKVAIAGGSAGGMLIGNVINQRPELFGAAVAHVPFVDVLNTMLDEDLPLTPGEFKEWGNPKEKEYFDYIKSYCPYSNVATLDYPNLLVTAGLSDPRVGYWEAAKWVAALRSQKTDNNIIIYKTNMDFGHSGASGRFDYLKETAEELVFVIKNVK